MPRIDRIAEPWGTRTPYGPGEDWPTRIDSFLADGLTEDDVDRWVPSATILHSNGDGLDIAVKDDQIVGVRGRAVDRVNHGRLGPKDLYGWQANNSPDRLTRPLVRRDGQLVELTGSSGWKSAAGWVGLLLAVVAVYAALALELEAARQGTVLPVRRRGPGRAAIDGEGSIQPSDLRSEAGVRPQL